MSLNLETDLTSALKSFTKIPHASLEKNLLRHLRNISCNADYISILRLMYGYYHPLENKIEAVLGREESSRKAAWILKDLDTLGNRFHNTPLCIELPVVTDEAEALGALYVLEGSTLGGVHIAQMIAKKIPGNPGLPLAFFEGYGADTLDRWKRFCSVLNEKNFSPREKEKALTTAGQTFVLFEKWIRENEPGTV